MMFEFVGSVIALILFVFSYIHLKRFVIMKRLHILMGWMVYMLGSHMRVAGYVRCITFFLRGMICKNST